MTTDPKATTTTKRHPVTRHETAPTQPDVSQFENSRRTAEFEAQPIRKGVTIATRVPGLGPGEDMTRDPGPRFPRADIPVTGWGWGELNPHVLSDTRT